MEAQGGQHVDSDDSASRKRCCFFPLCIAAAAVAFHGPLFPPDPFPEGHVWCTIIIINVLSYGDSKTRPRNGPEEGEKKKARLPDDERKKHLFFRHRNRRSTHSNMSCAELPLYAKRKKEKKKKKETVSNTI